MIPEFLEGYTPRRFFVQMPKPPTKQADGRAGGRRRRFSGGPAGGAPPPRIDTMCSTGLWM
eukprot:13177146-Alexandrium_andersonii.AAC.1